MQVRGCQIFLGKIYQMAISLTKWS
jgi:hypothetical protein